MTLGEGQSWTEEGLRCLFNNLHPEEEGAIDIWLDKAKAAGFNTVSYPVGIFHNRTYVPQKRPVAGYDPAVYFIEAAHERGLRVICWWATFFSRENAKEYLRQHKDVAQELERQLLAKVSPVPSTPVSDTDLAEK